MRVSREASQPYVTSWQQVQNASIGRAKQDRKRATARVTIDTTSTEGTIEEQELDLRDNDGSCPEKRAISTVMGAPSGTFRNS
jgi:hypothetical protein